jgi:hypothetical protein
VCDALLSLVSDIWGSSDENMDVFKAHGLGASKTYQIPAFPRIHYHFSLEVISLVVVQSMDSDGILKDRCLHLKNWQIELQLSISPFYRLVAVTEPGLARYSMDYLFDSCPTAFSPRSVANLQPSVVGIQSSFIKSK